VSCLSGHKLHYAIVNAVPPPRRGRRTFAIQEVRGPDDRSNLDPTPESLTAINAAYAAGQIDWAEARKQVEAVRAALYAKRDAESARTDVFHSENAKLLERYWAAEYADRDLVDAASMRTDLARAIAAVGLLSLLAAPRAELQAAVVERLGDRPAIHRRAVDRLNQLLRFAGRDFKLRKPKPERAVVRYLTRDHLLRVLPHLPSDEWRLFAETAWLTGCRLGECFAIQPQSLKPKYLWVAAQLDRKRRVRDTKTGNERKVHVLLGTAGRAVVAAWAAVPKDRKDALRQARHATTFGRACKKAGLPKATPHDLRHSYAVYLVSKGVPLTLVAQSLGNSVAVCERYYSGFVLADESLETIDRILSDE
jgi:integrase